MNKILLSLACVLYAGAGLVSQADLQWLVLDGKGKDGVTASALNNYAATFGGWEEFNLEGIMHPDTGYYEYTKNDLFVLYADGQHFNSRVKPATPDPGFFYNYNAFRHHFVNHHLTSPYDVDIQYMYLSNIYEADDPPEDVRVLPGTTIAGYTNYTMPSPSFTVDPMFANHDVVRYKDITLILDNGKILDKAAELGIIDISKCYLEYGTIEPIIAEDPEETPPEVPYNPDYFEVKPVFHTTSGGSSFDVPWFPTSNGVIESDQFSWNPHATPFSYINLNPTTLLADADCYPGESGEPRYRSVFSVKAPGGEVITTLIEDIRDSHDPNFIRIDSIGRDKQDNFVVFFHLEFENTSMTPPDSVVVTFKLPSLDKTNCFEVTKWYLGMPIKKARATVSSKNVTCDYRGQGLIRKCLDPRDKSGCTGYVEFKVKIDKMHDVFNPSTDIWVKEPIVYFDDTPYRIQIFRDLLTVKFLDQTLFLSEYTRPVRHIPRCKVTCK